MYDIFKLRSKLEEWKTDLPPNRHLRSEIADLVFSLREKGVLSAPYNELNKDVWASRPIKNLHCKVIELLKFSLKYFEDRDFYSQMNHKRRLTIQETVRALKETKLHFCLDSFGLLHALPRLQLLFSKKLSREHNLKFINIINEYQKPNTNSNILPNDLERIFTAKTFLFIDSVIEDLESEGK